MKAAVVSPVVIFVSIALGSCSETEARSPIQGATRNIEGAKDEFTIHTVIDVESDRNMDLTQLESVETADIPHTEEPWMRDLEIDGIEYDIYIPPSHGKDPNSPSLLVLPGWDYPRQSWVDNTNLVDLATQYGYALILPEMGITLYESRYYDHTDPNYQWYPEPGGTFIRDRFIPAIQQRHGLLQHGQHNMMLGLSTGGRGVALIALENPGLFVVGASLSGDFDQTATPDDRLMTGIYGPYSQFPNRWEGRDNPQRRVGEWHLPLYLAHGVADDIVPESQSRNFYEAIIAQHGDNGAIVYVPVPDAGHDYAFWGGQLEEVFEFLEAHRR